MNSSPVVSESFSRDDRLRKRREFEECYASGVRVSGRHLQVYLLADPSRGRLRLGISVGRRVGDAVTRNRVRRRLREIFRRSESRRSGLSGSLVVHAKPTAASADYKALREDYAKAVSKAAARRG